MQAQLNTNIAYVMNQKILRLINCCRCCVPDNFCEGVTIDCWSLILTTMNIQIRYRRPILIAVLLHVLLFCVLIFSFAPTLFRMPSSSAPMNTIHATAVSQADVQMEINAIHQKENE